jgi:acyl-coenzyme A synthetase/AMP-(fatty) acid ligase
MLFAIDAAAKRDHVAVIEAGTGQSWTYGELVQRTGALAAAFSAPGPGLFFHFCGNDPQAVALYLAAIEAGHAVALLSPRLDAGLRENLIALYRPDWIAGIEEGTGTQQYRRGEDGIWRRNEPAGPALFRGLSLLLSTSGSTGSPKFVRLTRANVEANAESIAVALGIGASDRPVAHLPLHYSYGLSVLNSHLWAGATILLTGAGLVSGEFWASLRQHEVDSFSGVPYTYQMLRRLGLGKLDVPRLRIMTQAGGKLDTGNISFFADAMRQRGGSFWTMYGQTEATARITILPPGELPARLGSAGRAIPGGRLSILDDHGAYTTAAGVEGELVYDGPNVMLGYAMERGDLSKGDELGGRLHTGDRAVLDEQGFVRILGRVKRDAKVFGLRMNLDEVEAFIRPKGPAAAVAGGNGVVVFCEFGDPAQYAALGDELSAKLKIHRSAFEFRHIDRLPTRDTGKIAYEALQELL